MTRARMCLFLLALGFLSTAALAEDWPQWRYGPGRGAASPAALPEKLNLAWTLSLGTPRPAWPEQEKLQFDSTYQPVAAGERLFVPSSVTGSVTAYSTRSGELLWRFYSEGPVRFAPVVWKDRILFASDDGFLYCLAADSGKLLWKFSGAPNMHQVLGNERLVSMWPARGGPVIQDETVYFAAGIWPFMGVFVHAVDPASGKPVWTNSGTGSNYIVQQHNSPAFAGVAPQGYLAANSSSLFVSGGRTVPASFDRATGNFRYFEPGNRQLSKSIGGFEVVAGEYWFENHGSLFTAETGQVQGRRDIAVVSPRHALSQEGNRIVAISPEPERKETYTKDRRGTGQLQVSYNWVSLWQADAPPGMSELWIQAGDRIYGSGSGGLIVAGNLPQKPGDPITPSWQGKINGSVGAMLAADDRLFVVSTAGDLFCFSGEPAGAVLPEQQAAAGELIPQGASWKYLDDGSDQKTGWRAADFDDAAWKSGPGELGYGDGDEATKVGFGPVAARKFITTYFRHAFEIPSDRAYKKLSLKIKADDGAVLYLNGREAARIGMPAGDIHFDTPAAHSSSEDFQLASLSAELLVPGKNVLAVEIHQRSGDSSDISFDLQLAGTLAISPTRSQTAAAPHNSAENWIELANVKQGYALVLGSANASALAELARQAELRIVALHPEPAAANALREELAEKGLLGTRIDIQAASLQSHAFAPYFASVIFCPSLAEANIELKAEDISRLFQLLRPYGGVAVLKLSAAEQAELSAIVAAEKLAGAKIEQTGEYTLLSRLGALPDSAPWSHQNGDVGNTMISADARVKTPLGLLWYGGPSNSDVLPRHGHGPTPQVLGGRIFIEGPNMLRALDVYTGRLLWQRELPGLGLYYDNTGHHAGAGAIGGNYVSTDDGIYVAYGREGLRLDPATGKTLATFTLPADASGEKPVWGYIGVYEDLLIAGSSPLAPYTPSRGRDDGSSIYAPYAEGSQRLVVLDRHSGKVLWQRDAKFNFRHNAIAAGGGRIYAIDRLSSARLSQLQRRGGKPPEGAAVLYALDAKTGQVAWRHEENVTGTWVAYSEKHNGVLEAGSMNRDRARDETGGGMTFLSADTGKVLWRHDETYGGPPLIHTDAIITQGWAYDVKTGKRTQRKHPLTGDFVDWNFSRNYGCNTAIGCENLLTFRSAAAGFYDLAGDGGTGNLGGFRSSCTANLIPADGVLAAPDYTRTCSCSYQNQCSLALIHMPQAELWTFNHLSYSGQRVEKLGINFGAPGDRREGDLLWLDYPSVGGRSPDVPVYLEGENITFYRQHASQIRGEEGDLAWVAASGMRGAKAIRLVVSGGEQEETRYTVRLHFAETDPVQPGQRVFTVSLQGRPVLKSLDILQEAGGYVRPLVKEFKNISVRKELFIEFTAEKGQPLLSGLEVVRE